MTRTVFLKYFTALCEVFEKQPSDILVETYYQTLKGLSDEQYAAAVNEILRTRIEGETSEKILVENLLTTEN